jgi:hypothetical protein
MILSNKLVFILEPSLFLYWCTAQNHIIQTAEEKMRKQKF